MPVFRTLFPSFEQYPRSFSSPLPLMQLSLLLMYHLYPLLNRCLTPRGPTTKHRQRPYQLGTHRLPLLKYLAWSCDHSSSDSREGTCMRAPFLPLDTLPSFKPCTSWVVHQALCAFPGCNCWPISSRLTGPRSTAS